MCLPVVHLAEVAGAPLGAASPSAAELAELGVHLAGERPAVEKALARTLPARLRGRYSVDLVEDVASAWVAEMFRRLAVRSAEHRALPVLGWARLVWRNALASAVREVDCRASGPVRLPKNEPRREIPAGRPCEPEDAVELPTPTDRAVRVAMMLRPAEVAAVLAEDPPGELWRVRSRRGRRRACAAAELRRVVEGEL